MAITAKLQAARDRVVAAAQAWRAQCQAWTAADGRTCDGRWYGYSTTDLKLRGLCKALDTYDKTASPPSPSCGTGAMLLDELPEEEKTCENCDAPFDACDVDCRRGGRDAPGDRWSESLRSLADRAVAYAKDLEARAEKIDTRLYDSDIEVRDGWTRTIRREYTEKELRDVFPEETLVGQLLSQRAALMALLVRAKSPEVGE